MKPAVTEATKNLTENFPDEKFKLLENTGFWKSPEYELVIVPGTAGNQFLPSPQPRNYAEGRRLALVFTRDGARNDITIEVQVSPNLSLGSWSTVAASVNGAALTGVGFVSN